MKLMWTGSDVLFATKFVKHSKKSKWIYMLGVRIFAKIADIFVEHHYVVSEHLIKELKPLNLKKKISVLVDPPKYNIKFEKKDHSGFNVLYYRCKGANAKFKNWVYGYDIVEKIKGCLDINIIEVSGDSDMKEIYPIIDCLIRPNRHDGMPRMVMECEQNEIPYYWSKEHPNTEDIIKFIENEIQRKTQGKI